MKYILLYIILSMPSMLWAQHFTRQDSLRGSITPERAWWDLGYYHMRVAVDPDEKFIKGQNEITYRVLEEAQIMQIDLQDPLEITGAWQDDRELEVTKDGYAHFIKLEKKQKAGDIGTLVVAYEGHPKEAVNAPWDGGFSWSKDSKGNHFVATSCQGLGASVWWPCKDHMYDEVDSMRISVEVPEDLVDVSNGRLLGVDHNKDQQTKTYHWVVKNPINNYGVNVNIGNYIQWSEVYDGEEGLLDLSYWVLEEDEKKARAHFKEVPRMLEAFEHWFGPYPFYEDGYKLVQVPYLGMEHQSSVTYGNGFQNGYKNGQDLSGTGWGLKFDFIIVHESGHEWFANNITHTDHADLWLHESFTEYSEGLYLDYHYGEKAGREYVRGTRANIENRIPMQGIYGVNYDYLPIDVYFKGSNMLNTLRSIVDDDDRWRAMFRGLNKKFRHKTVGSKDIEDYMAKFLGIDLTAFFEQYIRRPFLPVLEYYVNDSGMHYRWTSCADGFNMPVDVTIKKEKIRIYPTTEWQTSPYYVSEELDVDVDYYIGVMKGR